MSRQPQIDLAPMTVAQLGALIVEARRVWTRKQLRDPVGKVRERLATAAARECYTLAELFGTVAAPKRRPTRSREPASEAAPPQSASEPAIDADAPTDAGDIEQRFRVTLGGMPPT